MRLVRLMAFGAIVALAPALAVATTVMKHELPQAALQCPYAACEFRMVGDHRGDRLHLIEVKESKKSVTSVIVVYSPITIGAPQEPAIYAEWSEVAR